MREIQIIIAIVNNLIKIVKAVDKATQYQPTFKMETNLNRSQPIKTTTELIRLIQDPEDKIKVLAT